MAAGRSIMRKRLQYSVVGLANVFQRVILVLRFEGKDAISWQTFESLSVMGCQKGKLGLLEIGKPKYLVDSAMLPRFQGGGGCLALLGWR